jgi:hypothetical protein
MSVPASAGFVRASNLAAIAGLRDLGLAIAAPRRAGQLDLGSRRIGEE